MTGSYSVTQFGANRKVTVRGPLTAIIVPELKVAIDEQFRQHVKEIVFDLREASMLDSSGIGLLIATSNRLARSGGTLRVIHPSDDVFQLLSSMRLVARLHVQPGKKGLTAEEARAVEKSNEHLSR